MNDITATHPQHTNALWKKISSTINKVQKFTLENPLAKTKELLSHIPLDELIVDEVGSGISIVYRPYNRSAMELIAQREWPHDETNNTIDLLTNHTVLADVVNNGNGEPVFLPNENLSLADVGFSGYKSVLIIPIHLHYKMGVNIGAIILHHKMQENAYSDIEIVAVWQTFVERLTFFIQQHHQTRRDQLSSNARIDLLQKLAADQLTEEHEIIREITQQIRQWYREDRLFIIMKHLLDVDSYVFAYNDENDTDKVIIDNFRLQLSIAPEKLTRIIGSQDVIKKLRPEKSIHAKGLILSQDEIRTEGIDADCQSWLGITFYHPLGFALGHIILHNPTHHAYGEVESRFFSKFADLLGVVLANFRNKQKEKTINDIKQGIIEQEETEENEVYYSRCENSLCNTVSTFLGKIYGVHSLLIARIDRRTQQFVTVLNQGNIAFDQEFQSVARAHIDKLRIPLPDDVMQDLRNHAKKLTVEYPEGSGNKYLIAPMLVEHTSSVDDRQIIGCFITKAKRAGGLTAKAIDEISNALAYRVVQFDRSRRFDILNQFSKEVAELKPNNLTKQSILEIAHRHVKEIMFGDNLYISLYDQNEKEISFPLMYVNGEIREQASRIIDSNALGRTEEIILTKKTLRHRTKAESKAWYETPGHGEFMGNHLASWIGVPIFSPDGIQGVIAAYHPNFDAIYSKLDLFFLSDIAAQVSGLLRSLELSEANRKLEDAIANNTALQEANVVINNNEKSLKKSQTYLLQDISFRISRNLGLAKRQVSQAINDVDQACTSGDTKTLKFTLEGLNTAELAITQISTYARMMGTKEQSDFSFGELAEIITRQIISYRKLTIDFNIQGNAVIKSQYWTVFDSLYSILDDLLVKLNQNGTPIIIISIVQNEDSTTQLKITYDLGYPNFSSEDLNTTPNEEKLPYWRAKNNLNSINGQLSINTDTNKGAVEIKLKKHIILENQPCNVIIYDPDMGSLFSRWLLSNKKYTIFNISSIEDVGRYSNSSSLLVVNMDFVEKAKQLHELEEYLKNIEFMKLILLFDDSSRDHEIFNIYNPSVIIKYDGGSDIIGRTEFMSAIESIEKESTQ